MMEENRLSFANILKLIYKSTNRQTSKRKKRCFPYQKDRFDFFNEVFAPKNYKQLIAKNKEKHLEYETENEIGYVILDLDISNVRAESDFICRSLYFDGRTKTVRASQNKLVANFYRYLYQSFEPDSSLSRLRDALNKRNAEMITTKHQIFSDLLDCNKIGFCTDDNRKVYNYLKKLLDKDAYSALMYLMIVSLFPCDYDNYVLPDNYSHTTELCQFLDSTLMSKSDLDANKEIAIDYQSNIKILTNWIMSCPVNWGASDEATEIQHANICEGLLAMKHSGYDQLRPELYRQILHAALQSVEDDGLHSKSLRASTVSCTSLLLELVALEKDTITDYTRFEKISEILWNARNKKYGWGMYTKIMNDDECSTVYTFRALYVLANYPISQTNEYHSFCKQLFEYETNGTFGFYIKDNGAKAKLAPTAMFVSLYFIIEHYLGKGFRTKYHIKNAINFVYQKFVKENIQVEMEILYGIDHNGIGAKQAPWRHITVYLAVQALVLAYHHSMLSEENCVALKNRILSLLEDQLIYRENRKSAFYAPKDMEPPRHGNWTYPTMYLVRALRLLEDIENKKEGNK